MIHSTPLIATVVVGLAVLWWWVTGNEECGLLLRRQDVFALVREPVSRALRSSCGFAALHSVTGGMLSELREVEITGSIK